MTIRKAKKAGDHKKFLGEKKQTRIEILRSIADMTGLPKVKVESVLSTLATLLHSHMRKPGSGEFTVPVVGIKVRRVKKKAKKARKILSPLTGQEALIPGKPIRMVIKLTALKPLKLAVLE